MTRNDPRAVPSGGRYFGPVREDLALLSAGRAEHLRLASAQCCEQPRGVEVSIGRRDVTVTEAISQGPTTSHPPLGVALPWGTEGAP